MSRTVPKSDPTSRLNKLERRVMALERVTQSSGSAPSAFEAGTFNVTGASLTPLAGLSVPIQIGPSGLVKCELSAELLVPGGAVDVSVLVAGAGPSGATFLGNSGTNPAGLYLVSGLSGANVSITTTTTTVIGPLKPGQWTFSLQTAQPSATGTAHVLNPFLQLTPL